MRARTTGSNGDQKNVWFCLFDVFIVRSTITVVPIFLLVVLTKVPIVAPLIRDLYHVSSLLSHNNNNNNNNNIIQRPFQHDGTVTTTINRMQQQQQHPNPFLLIPSQVVRSTILPNSRSRVDGTSDSDAILVDNKGKITTPPTTTNDATRTDVNNNNDSTGNGFATTGSGDLITKRRRRRNRKNTNNNKKKSKNGTPTVVAKSKTEWFNNSTKNQLVAARNAVSNNRKDNNNTDSEAINADEDGDDVVTDVEDTTRWLTSGNYPDINWRAISMEHLRQHPKFSGLPEPQTIQQLQQLGDVQLFRQDSWQWDALHAGRCTTSQAVAALGFLEPETAEVLDVPKSWRRGGMGAYIRLRQKPLRTLDEMNRVLCNNDNNKQQHEQQHGDDKVKSTKQSQLWSMNDGDGTQQSSTSSSSSSYVAQYNFRISKNEMIRRKKEATKFSQNDNIGLGIRMMWGSAQEATSLLTALNYFAKQDPSGTFYIRESGLCGAGLQINQAETDASTSSSSSLLIGATPDGILCHADGTLEALEVKNHCPFYSSYGRPTRTAKKTSLHRAGQRSNKRFGIGDRPFDQEKKKGKGNGIFAHYIPQLMMEMLCLGPECKSAVMVRQTATVGALILRLHRDEEWINEMIYWLQQFQTMYVTTNIPPPRNFFYNNTSNRNEQSRYRRFVNRTLELRNQVQVVAYIPNDQIQRVPGNTSLFLD